jgi:2-succinyl-6-hydroxy-2,4-cyclohexadiene-1-carboxylate synthase
MVNPGALFADRRGAGERITLVHGFTQNRNCWGPIADDLARDHELVLIDAPGHGASRDVAVSFEAGAGLIGEAGGAGTYLGYSMGGRYCLRLAVDRPDLVQRLVLVGASPGLASADERDQRTFADGSLADRLEAIGVAAFVDEWLALTMFEHLPPSMRFVEERLTNDADALAFSLRSAGSGAQEPIWERLPQLAIPVLLVTGAYDTKFTAIASEMAALIGADARHVVVPDAGHTAHLEQPDAFLSALRAWFTAHPVPPNANSAPDRSLG